jgi:hypothetical protein
MRCTCFEFSTLLAGFLMKWAIGACYDGDMVWKCLAEMRAVGALLLLVFASIIAVGLEKASPVRNAAAHEAGPYEAAIVPQFAIEDFDGDSRPDIATVVEGRSGAANNHYRIRFQLSSGGSQNIDLTAPVGGLDLSSRDVNGDDVLDVVVTTAGTNWPVAILLNDGAGTFTASDPAAFPGAFRKSSKFWRALTEELHEASPAFFSRFFSSDLEVNYGTFSPLVELGVFASWSDRLETRDAEMSYLGRAPPSLKHTL